MLKKQLIARNTMLESDNRLLLAKNKVLIKENEELKKNIKYLEFKLQNRENDKKEEQLQFKLF